MALGFSSSLWGAACERKEMRGFRACYHGFRALLTSTDPQLCMQRTDIESWWPTGPLLTCTHPRPQHGLFRMALGSTAPGASCSPVASFSLQRQTRPQQRLWSQCSWPAEERGLQVDFRLFSLFCTLYFKPEEFVLETQVLEMYGETSLGKGVNGYL